MDYCRLREATALEQNPCSLFFSVIRGTISRRDVLVNYFPVLQERGIQVQYSEDVEAVLTDKGLEGLDGVILYANIDNLGDQQAGAASAFRLTRWWIYSVALCFLLLSEST